MFCVVQVEENVKEAESHATRASRCTILEETSRTAEAGCGRLVQESQVLLGSEVGKESESVVVRSHCLFALALLVFPLKKLKPTDHSSRIAD